MVNLYHDIVHQDSLVNVAFVCWSLSSSEEEYMLSSLESSAESVSIISSEFAYPLICCDVMKDGSCTNLEMKRKDKKSATIIVEKI